jgi:hypothetical protein
MWSRFAGGVKGEIGVGYLDPFDRHSTFFSMPVF